ncbi:MAG TPA: SRPBCC family protein [Acidimicrobiales bacterium]|nr:SRPBCC family protein [Acidimicrobiales bacterium]
MTTESVEIAAPAETVWSLVSDLTRMPEWSPETIKVAWTRGSSGPVAGATFKGTNRANVRRWSTSCRIIVADPPQELAWEVYAPGKVKVAEWRYRIETLDERSCRVTELAVDHRPGWFKLATNVITGITDREAHNAKGMRETLARIKAAAEDN